MLRALCVTMALLTAARTTAAEERCDLNANAALKYWQAFAQLPKLTDAEAQTLNRDCLSMPLDAHARELVAKAEYALHMMHEGAAVHPCAWGMDWEKEGIAALLPQMSAARLLSSVACLDARLGFEEGRTTTALDDLVDALAMGRHVSLDGSLLGVLVGYSMEARVGEALALYLPRLEPSTIQDLKKRLERLPPGGTPAGGLLAAERKTREWFIRKVKQAKDRESLLALLQLVVVSERNHKDPAQQARAFLESCGGADGILRFAEQALPSYARMAAKLNLPPEQFAKEFAQESNRQARNPVFQMFFPALEKCRWAQARADVRRALLAAALDAQLEGPNALKNHPDPVVGGPFEYIPFPGGFELRSKSRHGDDRPITLTVGQRRR